MSGYDSCGGGMPICGGGPPGGPICGGGPLGDGGCIGSCWGGTAPQQGSAEEGDRSERQACMQGVKHGTIFPSHVLFLTTLGCSLATLASWNQAALEHCVGDGRCHTVNELHP